MRIYLHGDWHRMPHNLYWTMSHTNAWCLLKSQKLSELSINCLSVCICSSAFFPFLSLNGNKRGENERALLFIAFVTANTFFLAMIVELAMQTDSDKKWWILKITQLAVIFSATNLPSHWHCWFSRIARLNCHSFWFAASNCNSNGINEMKAETSEWAGHRKPSEYSKMS